MVDDTDCVLWCFIKGDFKVLVVIAPVNASMHQLKKLIKLANEMYSVELMPMIWCFGRWIIPNA